MAVSILLLHDLQRRNCKAVESWMLPRRIALSFAKIVAAEHPKHPKPSVAVISYKPWRLILRSYVHISIQAHIATEDDPHLWIYM